MRDGAGATTPLLTPPAGTVSLALASAPGRYVMTQGCQTTANISGDGIVRRLGESRGRPDVGEARGAP